MTRLTTYLITGERNFEVFFAYIDAVSFENAVQLMQVFYGKVCIVNIAKVCTQQNLR